ncbi:MAG: PIN domain-containing protein, partial [Nitriliruptorales bacterium]
LSRYPTLPLTWRAYELRDNVTAYDAVYVALAEGLACSLVTADARLSRAPGIRCDIEVLSAS